MVKINTSESKPDGGDWLSEECDCHLIVDNFEDFSNDKSPHLHFDFRILSAVKPGGGNLLASAIGKSLKKERFALTPSAAGRLLELACAVGLYTKDQWRKDKEAGIDADIDFSDAVGRQLCSPIRHKAWREPDDTQYWSNELKDAKAAGDQKKINSVSAILERKQGRLQVGGEKGFAFWGLGDPDSDHITLDKDHVATFAGNLPTKNGTTRQRPSGGGAGSSAKLPPKPPAGGNGNGSHASGGGQPAMAGAGASGGDGVEDFI